MFNSKLFALFVACVIMPINGLIMMQQPIVGVILIATQIPFLYGKIKD